jgi:hypothetical protein
MSKLHKKRIFGKKINFKSLSCAPVNELGVVYLFGVLHDTFDFKIESVQAGFPDCIARRKVSDNRWEEIRIEFEYESKSFETHGHDIEGADMIVCWKHNWKNCPQNIEVIELSSLLGDAENIDEQIKTKKSLTEWQKFCQVKRLEGLEFTKIAKLWKQKKGDSSKSFKMEV